MKPNRTASATRSETRAAAARVRRSRSRRPGLLAGIGIGLSALALPGLPISAAPAGAALAQGQGELQRAADALRAIVTMRADFTQTDRNGQVARGVMTLKRPGKIRFEYEKSVPLLIVSNGRSLYMVDYEVKQVQRWPIGKSPLGALLDPDRDISRFGKLIPTGSPDVVSIEVRDPERPEFGKITMIFVRDDSAPGGLELTSWVALDAQNNRTTVRLRNHRYGVAVSDAAFRFNDPRRTTRRPR